MSNLGDRRTINGKTTYYAGVDSKGKEVWLDTEVQTAPTKPKDGSSAADRASKAEAARWKVATDRTKKQYAQRNTALMEAKDDLSGMLDANLKNNSSAANYKDYRAQLKSLLSEVKDSDLDGSVKDEAAYKDIKKALDTYPKTMPTTSAAPTKTTGDAPTVNPVATVLKASAANYAAKMNKLAGGKGIQDVADNNKSNDEMKQYEGLLSDYNGIVKKLNIIGDHSLDKSRDDFKKLKSSKAYVTQVPGTDPPAPTATTGQNTTTTTTNNTKTPTTNTPRSTATSTTTGSTPSSTDTSSTKPNKNTKPSKAKKKPDTETAGSSVAGGGASSGSSNSSSSTTSNNASDTNSSTNGSSPESKSTPAAAASVKDILNDDSDAQTYVLGRFEKAFGADGDNQYKKAVNGMLAADPKGIKIIDNKAGGSFSVQVKNAKGEWTGATEVVTAALGKYVDYSGATAEAKQDITFRLGTDGSAVERHILARFNKAYGDANGRATMYAATDAALQTSGGNVREFGTRGQPGYFVAVKDSRGNWSSRGETVTDELVKYVPAGGTPDQTTVLLNASGSGHGTTVIKDYIAAYGDPTIAQNAFYASIDAYNKAKPNAIREFGTRGTDGHYVEVKTKDGWVGNTNKVTDVLAKYAPSRKDAAKLGAPGGQLSDTPAAPPSPVAAPKALKDSDNDYIANTYDVWDNTVGVPKSVNKKAELLEAQGKLQNKIAAAQATGNASLNDDIAALQANLAEVNTKLAERIDPDNDTIRSAYDVWNNTSGVPGSINTKAELKDARKDLEKNIEKAQKAGDESLADDILGLQANLTEVNNRLAAKTNASIKPVSGTISAGVSGATGQTTIAPAAAPTPAAAPATTPVNNPEPQPIPAMSGNTNIGAIASDPTQATRTTLPSLSGAESVGVGDENGTANDLSSTLDRISGTGSAGADIGGTVGQIITPAPAPAPAIAPEIVAVADRNDNGVVGKAELDRFEEIADADASGEVTAAEAQAFDLIDTNNNSKIGKKELKAFRKIDSDGSGSLSTTEATSARDSLRAQINNLNTQEKRTLSLAEQYLAKYPEGVAGSTEVNGAAGALVSANKTESSLKEKKKKK